MTTFFRILKRISIYHQPLWLWIIKVQYACMEHDGAVSERAW